MRVSVGDCRLYVDVEGLGLVPDGPTMRERPTVVVQHWQAGEERTFDLRGSLDRIERPVLVLAGEDDPICPASGSGAIAAEIGPGRCTLQVVPDCGHGVWRDRPEVGFEAMRAFVAG
jgi:pimeloyl-ACP methyl ester carboxylesterase